MKKFLAMMLAVTSLFVVSACYEDDNNENSDTKAPVVMYNTDVANSLEKPADCGTTTASVIDFTEYFTVTDDVDGDITVTNDMLSWDTAFDYCTAGTYKLSLTVSDAAGNTPDVTPSRTITVVEGVKPGFWTLDVEGTNGYATTAVDNVDANNDYTVTYGVGETIQRISVTFTEPVTCTGTINLTDSSNTVATHTCGTEAATTLVFATSTALALDTSYDFALAADQVVDAAGYKNDAFTVAVNSDLENVAPVLSDVSMTFDGEASYNYTEGTLVFDNSSTDDDAVDAAFKTITITFDEAILCPTSTTALVITTEVDGNTVTFAKYSAGCEEGVVSTKSLTFAVEADYTEISAGTYDLTLAAELFTDIYNNKNAAMSFTVTMSVKTAE